MKKKITLALAALTAVNTFFCGTAFADEKTGREIREVLGDLTQELNVAQEKVAKIEEQRLTQKNANAKDLLPQRAKALKDLEKLSDKYHSAKSPDTRKELSKQIESKILKTSELGTILLSQSKMIWFFKINNWRLFRKRCPA